jgi:hypothetical protein
MKESRFQKARGAFFGFFLMGLGGGTVLDGIGMGIFTGLALGLSVAAAIYVILGRSN